MTHFIVIFSFGKSCLHYCRIFMVMKYMKLPTKKLSFAPFHGESIILKNITLSSEHAEALKMMQILSAYI